MSSLRYINRSGSAIIITLIILILLTILSTSFLEKLFRFQQASEGIENSNVAYYLAGGMIEDTLNASAVTKKTPWKVSNSGTTSTSTGRSMTVATGGTQIPLGGKGNSPYSPDWNIIGMGEPVQIVLPSISNWNSVNFRFRVPQITSSSSTSVTNGGSGIILWTLSMSGGVSLFASGETNIFRGNQIDSLNKQIYNFTGTTNTGSEKRFTTFYGDYNTKCNPNYECTLKLSMLRPVKLDGTRELPFLEYQIEFPAGTTVPSQYMTLTASGYSNGFLRIREIQFPQITTNSALDYAVLQ